ncbi:hypothetical protein LO772_26730 [Yinghuangia sp. ASG 101]|uniref:hypothetical protein n=1 Tax=Yinghuangia sp. ASG 101 TaxID=2896848 RepID=UPI001E39EEF5|nr:hypothetical protein [Yinghuangia sp. ASG 101]UGQ10418.1 hypothetical protein LO772_26730 [Yinghuangia sp. ASG 101]
MPTIGITGHMDITSETARLVEGELRARLASIPPAELVGVSCIAKGADALFANVVVSIGGRLVVVLPSRDYREAKVKPDHRGEFDALVARAEEVRTMPYETADRDAYTAANEHLVSECEALFAVWDGQPPSGKGGTGDVVAYARRVGVPVTIVWPEGAVRG